MAEERNHGTKQLATERADQLLSRVGSTVGLVGSMVGTRLARIAAFAREEAEDMWAEAQHLRQQEVRVREVKEQKPEPVKSESQTSAHPTENTESVQATETARQRAEELGVDLQEVEGSGKSGKITVSDVKKKAQEEVDP